MLISSLGYFGFLVLQMSNGNLDKLIEYTTANKFNKHVLITNDYNNFLPTILLHAFDDSFWEHDFDVFKDG